MSQSAPAISSSPAAHRDDSWLSVGLLLALLLVVIALVLFIWLPLTPQAPRSIDKYAPFPNGGSFTYRVKHPDGSITYLSRNIARVRANVVAPTLSLNVFTALMNNTKIDVTKTDAATALLQLSTVQVAQINDVVDDARGNPVGHSSATLLFQNDQIGTLGFNDAGFEPALPLLTTSSTPQTTSGKFTNGGTYSTTLSALGIETVQAPLGELKDCLHVQQILELSDNTSTSQSWYCAGIGEARNEVQDADGKTLYELVAVSAGDVHRGNAPLIPAANIQASLQAVWDSPLQGTVEQIANYQEPTNSQGVSTPILPAGNFLVYGTTSGALVALDWTTKTERWRFQTGAAIFSAPLVANGVAYFGSADKTAYAARVVDGAFLWSFRTNDVIAATPAFADDTVYITSEDRTLYTLDADTGLARWTFSGTSPLIAQPVVSYGVVYVSSASGKLYALDAHTGAQRWQYTTGEAIIAPVVVQNGAVYFGSYDKKLYSLDAASGALNWSRELGTEIRFAPILAEGRVYVVLNNEVFALDAATGSVVWRYQSARQFFGAPVITGNQLWTTRDVDLVALDTSTGAVLQTVPTEQGSTYAGATSDGLHLFVGHFDGLVQVLGVKP